ncbi:MAG: GNAT family N-acetyltransferase [Polyangiaceae bacterium]
MSDARFSIRRASVGDITEIQRVGLEADERYVAVGYPEAADGTTIPTDAATRAIGDDRLFVAVVEDRVVGWVYIGRVGGELCIGQISVTPSFGRLGIGSALLERVIEMARAAGERSIVLNTQSDVAWCRPWYERHGFVVVPREEWTAPMASVAAAQAKDGLDWSTRVHMRRRLDEAPRPPPTARPPS